MRFNPFRPNSPVAPGMFVGRIDEIQSISQALNQTRNGNPTHFLIQGERGIGKSSLLMVATSMASGGVSVEPGQKDSFQFPIMSIDLGGCKDRIDVIRAFGRGLKSMLRSNDELKERAKAVWTWLTEWEVLGVRKHKGERDFDPLDAVDQIVENIASFYNSNSDYIDGIFIVVDEADAPGVSGDLGQVIKSITEELGRRGVDEVLFGVAGVTGILPMLRESHESAPRLFTVMTLEPLELHERITVIDIGLENANAKNAQETIIKDSAKEYLSEMSEGYPHFLQQFAYCAFQADEDGVISVEDISEGAFQENGAIAQLGEKFFSDMYRAKINSDDYRKVLDGMAEFGDSWVERKQLLDVCDVSAPQLDNALRALKDREIIIADDAKRGSYRLPTKSFAVWIKAVPEKGK